MHNGIKGWLSRLAINQQCVLCHQTSRHSVCQYCCDDIPRFSESYQAQDLLVQPKVLRELKVISFDRLIALAEYQYPYAYLLTRLKFHRKVVFAKALANLFCQLRLGVSDRPLGIVPIPLHQSRLVTRKYNQASLMANFIAKYYGLELFPQALKRVRNSRPQTELNGTQRLKNALNMFTLDQGITVNHIAIFDDVITTGATVSAAAEALRDKYPDIKIDVWALCVTPAH